MTVANVTQGINASAMLIDLRISQWTARKLDKRATAQATRDAGAEDGSGSFYKTLVNSEYLDQIKKLTTKIRTYHYQMTLPWSDAGPRVLPADAYLEYQQQMQTYKSEFEQTVDAFLQDYPAARQEARRILGSLFDDEDYPPTEVVAEKFRMGYSVLPIPAADDFRVSLAGDEVDAIKQEINQHNEALLAKTMQEVYERILKVAESFVDRLGTEDKIFRNSLVENARTLRDLLPKFNLTQDPKLEELAEKMDKLCEYEPDQLRANWGTKQEVHAAAVEIKSDLLDFFNGEFK